MKKLTALLLTLCVALTFFACSGGETNDTMYKIGVTQITDHGSLDNCRNGFIEAFKEAGLVEGKDFEIDFQSAQGDMNTATQIAQKFAADGKDLVCGIATPSAQSLYAACYDKDIPVIFNAVSDPVEANLAKSETESLPGITGVSDALPVEDQLKLIREVLPDAKKIGIIYTTSEANSVSTLKTYQELAPKYGFEIVEKGIAKQAEITSALDVILPQVDCISNMTDNTVVSALGVMLEKANAVGVPVFGSEEEQVVNGCIAAAGLDYFELGKQAGVMAIRVLKGEKPAAIPYETMKESSVTVNTGVAAALGVTISDAVLENATDVK